ncbi:MAG TPA: hypothetical protein VFX98_17110 [Longimicrobiaceae bacterium]|nr:hypothetical protein [Longimicrobiaceae bacterium]
MTRIPPAALAAAALLLAACGAEPHGSPAPASLADPARHALHLGLDEGPADATLGRVVSARLAEGGGHVVVLDFVPPFVKVFDGSGRFRTAFLGRGGGPGESRRPVAVAVAGDSAVLVADGPQHLSLFDLDGKLLAQAPVPGLLPMAAASPCPGEWLVYGPRRDERWRRGNATWLHRVRFTGPSTAEVESLVLDSVAAPLVGGPTYGIVPDAGGAVVQHTLGARPRLLRLDCAGGEPRVLHEGEPGPAMETPRQVGREARLERTPGTRSPGGVAVVPGGVVFGEKVYLGSGRRGRLDLTLLDGGAPRRLAIEGDYVLQDSRPGVGVLMSTGDPVPQVFLVSAEEFLAMFPAR